VVVVRARGCSLTRDGHSRGRRSPPLRRGGLQASGLQEGARCHEHLPARSHKPRGKDELHRAERHQEIDASLAERFADRAAAFCAKR
jgi:hypothetical protein